MDTDIDLSKLFFADGDTLKPKSGKGNSIRLSDANTFETQKTPPLGERFDPRSDSPSGSPTRYFDPRGDLATVVSEQLTDSVSDSQGEDFYGRELRQFLDREGNSVGERLIDQHLAYPTNREQQVRATAMEWAHLTGRSRYSPSDLQMRDVSDALSPLSPYENVDPTASDYYAMKNVRGKYARNNGDEYQRSIWRGKDQAMASIGAAAYALGNAIGNEDLARYGKEVQAFNQMEAGLYERDSRDLRAILEDKSTDFFDKGFESVAWAIETGFEETIPMAIDLAIATVGSLAGGAGLGAVAARRLAKRGAHKAIERYLDTKQADKKTSDYIKAQQMKGAKIGSAIGLYGSNIPQSVGEAEMTAQELGLETGSINSILTGIFAAGIDTTADWLLVGKVLDKVGVNADISRGIIGKAKLVARDSLHQAGVEGLTESVQEATYLLSAVAQGGDISNIAPDGDWQTALAYRLGEAALAGATVGGATGGVGSLVGLLGNRYQQEQNLEKEVADFLRSSAEPEETVDFSDVYEDGVIDESMPDTASEFVASAESRSSDLLDWVDEPDSAESTPMPTPYNAVLPPTTTGNDTGTGIDTDTTPPVKEALDAPSAAPQPMVSLEQSPQSFASQNRKRSEEERITVRETLTKQAERLVERYPALKPMYDRIVSNKPIFSSTKRFSLPAIGSDQEVSGLTSLSDLFATYPAALKSLIVSLEKIGKNKEAQVLRTFAANKNFKAVKKYLSVTLPTQDFSDAFSSMIRDYASSQDRDRATHRMYQMWATSSQLNTTRYNTVGEIKQDIATSLLQKRSLSESNFQHLTAMFDRNNQAVTEADIKDALVSNGIAKPELLANIIHAAATDPDMPLSDLPYSQVEIDEAIQSNMFNDRKAKINIDELQTVEAQNDTALFQFVSQNRERQAVDKPVRDNTDIRSRFYQIIDLKRSVPKKWVDAIKNAAQNAPNTLQSVIREAFTDPEFASKVESLRKAIDGFVKEGVSSANDPLMVMKALMSSDNELSDFIKRNLKVEGQSDIIEAMDNTVAAPLINETSYDVNGETEEFGNNALRPIGGDPEQRSVVVKQAQDFEAELARFELKIGRKLTRAERKIYKRVSSLMGKKDITRFAKRFLSRDKPKNRRPDFISLAKWYQLFNGTRYPVNKYDQEEELERELEETAQFIVEVGEYLSSPHQSEYQEFEGVYGETVADHMNSMLTKELNTYHFVLSFLNRMGVKARLNQDMILRLSFGSGFSNQQKRAIELYIQVRNSALGVDAVTLDSYESYLAAYKLYANTSVQTLTDLENVAKTDFPPYLTHSVNWSRKKQSGVKESQEWLDVHHSKRLVKQIKPVRFSGYNAARFIGDKILPEMPEQKGLDYTNQMVDAESVLRKAIIANNIDYIKDNDDPMQLSETGYSRFVRGAIIPDRIGEIDTPNINGIMEFKIGSKMVRISLPKLVRSIYFDAKAAISKGEIIEISEVVMAAMDAVIDYVAENQHRSDPTYSMNNILAKMPPDLVVFRNDYAKSGEPSVVTVAEILATLNQHQKDQTLLNRTIAEKFALETVYNGASFISQLAVKIAQSRMMIKGFESDPFTEKENLDSIRDMFNQLVYFAETIIQNNYRKYGLTSKELLKIEKMVDAGEFEQLNEFVSSFSIKRLDLDLRLFLEREDAVLEYESVDSMYRDTQRAIRDAALTEEQRNLSRQVFALIDAIQDLSSRARAIADQNEVSGNKSAVDIYVESQGTQGDEDPSDDKQSLEFQRANRDNVIQGNFTPGDLASLNADEEIKRQNAEFNAGYTADKNDTLKEKFLSTVVRLETYFDNFLTNKQRESGLQINDEKEMETLRSRIEKSPDNKVFDLVSLFDKVLAEAKENRAAYFANQPKTINKAPRKPKTEKQHFVDYLQTVANNLVRAIGSKMKVEIITGDIDPEHPHYADIRELILAQQTASYVGGNGTLYVYLPIIDYSSYHFDQPRPDAVAVFQLGHEIGHFLLKEAKNSKYWDQFVAEYHEDIKTKVKTTASDDDSLSIEYDAPPIEEWFADKMAMALLAKSHRDQQPAHIRGYSAYLKRLAAKLLNLYKTIAAVADNLRSIAKRQVYFDYSETFSRFLQEVADGGTHSLDEYKKGQTEYFGGQRPPLMTIAKKAKDLFENAFSSLQRQAGRISPKYREKIEQYTTLRRTTHSNLYGSNLKPVNDKKVLNKGYLDMLKGVNSPEAAYIRQWFDQIDHYFKTDSEKRFKFMPRRIFDQAPMRLKPDMLEKKPEEFLRIIKPLLKSRNSRSANWLGEAIKRLLSADGYAALTQNGLNEQISSPHSGEMNKIIFEIVSNKKILAELTEAGYVDTNGTQVLRGFIDQVAGYASYGATFGAYPFKKSVSEENEHTHHSTFMLQRILGGIKDRKDRERFIWLHDALIGRLNQSMPYNLRIGQSYLLTVSNMSILAFAGVASMPDIATPAIKTYSFKTVLKGFGHLATKPRVVYGIAKALGSISSQYMRQNAFQIYRQGEMAQGLPKALSDLFFTLNGQSLVNNINQIVASAMGMAMIEEVHLSPRSGLNQRMIARYDMDISLINRYFGGDRSESVVRHYNDVMTRFMTDAQMLGERSYRNPHAQNPWLLTVANLKNFPYDIAEVLIQPMYREIKARFGDNQYVSAMLPLMLAAALLLPMAALGWELREWLRSGKSPSDLPTDEYMMGVLKRTGVMSYAEIVAPLYYADRYDKPFLPSMVPSVGMVYDVIKADDWSKKAERVTPFANQNVPFKWNPYNR